MVRTYWLVQVFNEASWNLGLQPDRTDDQVESNSAPCYVQLDGSCEGAQRRAAFFLCFLCFLLHFVCFFLCFLAAAA